MLRRVHISELMTGSIVLPIAEAHYVRDVLRLEAGSQLELFDDSGNVATGIIKHVNTANVVVDVETIIQPSMGRATVTVAAAVPKGDRADWMVEKLTELGVARFIPLVAERSVVVPAGRNKIERWERIAIESAKQSRRTGVMNIAPLTTLDEMISSVTTAIYFSTAADAISIGPAVDAIRLENVTLLIGPEGGWTENEKTRMKSAGFTAAALTSTILRVETAAVTAAAVVLCLRNITAFRSVPNSA
jgi:16S rRNA (uracil1498-N3)-methyltransferase